MRNVSICPICLMSLMIDVLIYCKLTRLCVWVPQLIYRGAPQGLVPCGSVTRLESTKQADNQSLVLRTMCLDMDQSQSRMPSYLRVQCQRS